MKIQDLSKNCGEWLRGGIADDGGIVVSCRVRLARNLAGRNFITRLNAEEQADVLKIVREAVAAVNLTGTDSADELGYFDLEELSPVERTFLLERHLISKELAEKQGARGVVFDRREKLSLMINEEDHLRLQALSHGARLRETFSALNRIDDELSNCLDFAWTEDLGYLTACPSNVGTGMRISAMLHLPALAITKHIEKAFRAVGELHLAVRGFYGEGTRADGDLYQISNQITLGRSENELVEDLVAVVEELVTYEKKAREYLLEENRLMLEDRAWRSYALLREVRLINTQETMEHLSNLRLGTDLGILPPLDHELLNRLLLFSQPAHLQIIAGRELDGTARDALRAQHLRTALGN